GHGGRRTHGATDDEDGRGHDGGGENSLHHDRLHDYARWSPDGGRAPAETVRKNITDAIPASSGFPLTTGPCAILPPRQSLGGRCGRVRRRAQYRINAAVDFSQFPANPGGPTGGGIRRARLPRPWSRPGPARCAAARAATP